MRSGQAWIVLLAMGWLACQVPVAAAAEMARRALPEPLGYVSDHAAALSPDWKARIRSVCQDLERKTGVEMVVVTIRRPAPYPTVNDYASALYQAWGIGTAQQDHGVLILAAVEDRKAAITVGRGLIASLHPQMLESVGREYVEPAFRSGDPGEGLYRAVVALAASLQDVKVGGERRRHIQGLGFWITVTTAAGALAFLWWISRPDQRHPFRRIRRGEYWGAGQGGFGGDFGGFGGGTRGGGLQ